MQALAKLVWVLCHRVDWLEMTSIFGPKMAFLILKEAAMRRLITYHHQKKRKSSLLWNLGRMWCHSNILLLFGWTILIFLPIFITVCWKMLCLILQVVRLTLMIWHWRQILAVLIRLIIFQGMCIMGIMFVACLSSNKICNIYERIPVLKFLALELNRPILSFWHVMRLEFCPWSPSWILIRPCIISSGMLYSQSVQYILVSISLNLYFTSVVTRLKFLALKLVLMSRRQYFRHALVSRLFHCILLYMRLCLLRKCVKTMCRSGIPRICVTYFVCD